MSELSSPPNSPPLLNAPVVFVTGKGGVGKTTVAAALAYQAASAGLRACMVEFDDGESGDRALAGDRSVHHVVLSYDKALIDTLGQALGARLLARAVVGQRAIRRLIRAVPALREFAFLDRIRALREDKRYDRIIVDLPSTGHALDWLRVPRAFDRFLGRSPLGNMGRDIHELVVGPNRCDVVVVTLAEPLVVKETEELCRRLRGELDMTPALVVVNRTVTPDPAGAWEAAKHVASTMPGAATAANELLQILEARAEQADDTAYAFGLARAVDAARIISLPDAPHDPLAAEVAGWLLAGACA